MVAENNDKISRIFLIGIDGATWNVIDPMLQRGELPNCKKIIEKGVRGDLRSLEFTASPRVWTSIATGKSEEKHAILDFYNTIKDLKAKRIWDILRGKRSETANIFYWYLTWPPPKDFKDILVPGFLARDSRTVPRELAFLKDIELTQKMKMQESYDRTGLFYYLRQAFNAINNGVSFSTIWKALLFIARRRFKYYKELDSFFRLQMIKFYLHTDVFYHLLKTHPTDFSAILLPQTDQLGHKFWSFMEPEEFEKRTGVKVTKQDIQKYGNVIKDTYREVDQFIGKVYDLMTEEDFLIVLSDHGFGLVTEIFASLKIKSKNFLEILNIDKSAHCINIGSSYIITIDDPERRKDISQIASTIHNMRFLSSRKKIFNVKTNDKEIVLELLDLFLMNIQGANEILKKKVKLGDQVINADRIFINRSDITGVHEKVGILIMIGKNIRQNLRIPESHVFDIVPTLLYLKNLPVGKDMDGKVIHEAIDKKFLEEYQLEYIDTYELEDHVQVNNGEDYQMTSELKKRLENLGYI